MYYFANLSQKFFSKCVVKFNNFILLLFTARIEKLLLEDKCELCTPSQTKKVNDWVNLFINKYPEMFRAAMAKYAENLGIPIPRDERRRMIQVLGTYP